MTHEPQPEKNSELFDSEADEAVRYLIDVQNNQSMLTVEIDRMRMAVEWTLRNEGITEAEIDLVLVDDKEIQGLNQQWLKHDYPTDVLSFTYNSPPKLEGELIVGAERALRVSEEKQTSAQDELIWYVVHGTLHLIGYEDGNPTQRETMRAREELVLRALGCDWPLEQETQ